MRGDFEDRHQISEKEDRDIVALSLIVLALFVGLLAFTGVLFN